MTSFTVTGSELHDAATWVARATPTKATIPVLSGLLVDATVQDRIELRGFDYDTSMTARVGATIGEPGTLLVSAKLLAAVTKTVNRDVNVTISCEGSRVEVKSGKSEWTLPALPVDDYPRLPDLGEPVGSIDADQLRRGATRALAAVSRDASLPALAGVKVESDGDRMTLVGTDRFRLCAAEVDWRRKNDDPLGLVLPAALLDGAIRGLDSGAATLHVTDGGFGMTTDDRQVTGRLIGDPFPRWQALMPAPSTVHVEVEVPALIAVVDQAQALAEAALGTAGALRFDFADGEAAVSVSGDDRRAHAVCAVDADGESWTVHVAGSYVRDAAQGAGTDRIRLHYGGSITKPVLVTAVGDDSYRHLCMPVRPPAGTQ